MSDLLRSTDELCTGGRGAFVDGGYDTDPTQRGDEVAEEMRAWYEAHRPLTFMERLFGKRRRDSYIADELMLGLRNVVLNAEQTYARQRRQA
jgi:hypothetical protein